MCKKSKHYTLTKITNVTGFVIPSHTLGVFGKLAMVHGWCIHIISACVSSVVCSGGSDASKCQ